MNSTYQRIFCIILVVTVLSMSLSVYAEGEYITPIDKTEQGTLLWAIIQVLRAQGIWVDTSDLEAWSDYITQEIYQYLEETPELGDFAAWVFPWIIGTDLYGSLVCNENMLQDLTTFSNWLINEMNLVAGDTIILDRQEVYRYVDPAGNQHQIFPYQIFVPYNTIIPTETYYVGNIDQFHVGETYVFDNGATLTCRVSNQGLWFWAQGANGSYNFTTLSVPEGYDIPADSIQGFVFVKNVYDTANPQYSICIVSDSYLVPYSSNGTLAQWQRVFQASYIGTSVVIGDLDYPEEPTTDIVIPDGGEPYYITVEWPESIRVNNLPAVISPNMVTDPDLNSVYQEITPFFRTMESGLDVVRGIVLRMPVESLSCIFALMGAMVIFGILKIMREH